VYDETGGIWPSVPSATLAASNGEGCVSTCSNSFGYVGGDNFGDAVAVKGATLVVGAPYASVPTPAADGVGTGSAYVFHLSGRAWTQSDELYDPAEATAAAENWFGYQVAVLGRSSFMVSAPYDPRGAFNNATGAAYVFSRKGGTWTTYPTELTALDGAAGDYFGYDGLTTIGRKYVLVGSANSPDGGLYIFRHRGRRASDPDAGATRSPLAGGRGASVRGDAAHHATDVLPSRWRAGRVLGDARRDLGATGADPFPVEDPCPSLSETPFLTSSSGG
jgi:hypothetical protein